MEDINSDALDEWIAIQGRQTDKYLASLPSRRDFQTRLAVLSNQPLMSIPYYEAGRWFLWRRTDRRSLPCLCCRVTLIDPESVVLDPNQFLPDGAVAFVDHGLAPDAEHCAYRWSMEHSARMPLRILSLNTLSDLPEALHCMCSPGVAWTLDGRGFFYHRSVSLSDTQLNMEVGDAVCYHRLGTQQIEDRLIWPAPVGYGSHLKVDLDESGRFLFITANNRRGWANELLVNDLRDPLVPELDGHVTTLYRGPHTPPTPLGVVDDNVFLLTDYRAPFGMIAVTSLDPCSSLDWRPVVLESDQPIKSACLIAGLIAVNRTIDLISEVRLHRLDGTVVHTITPPDAGVINGPLGRFDRSDVLYSVNSPLYSSTVFSFDIASGTSCPLDDAMSSFDPSKFETRRLFCNSKDGTRVAIFVTHRRDIVLNGLTPTMLNGYGGFGLPMITDFRPDVAAWLERGGLFATAHTRGGGEYGHEWHQAGTLGRKQNVFDDFIAAAEHLIHEGYTSPRMLAIAGASNGGLLVGAVLTQRPDLFGAAVAADSVMDMVRYHLFTDKALWFAEYGSSDQDDALSYLVKYSPLHNIRQGLRYPATLLLAAHRDDVVTPIHSFKFTAALQEAQGWGRPVLLRLTQTSEHGCHSLLEIGDALAFAWENVTAE
jgi:prolyl oligopeptidase